MYRVYKFILMSIPSPWNVTSCDIKMVIATDLPVLTLQHIISIRLLYSLGYCLSYDIIALMSNLICKWWERQQQPEVRGLKNDTWGKGEGCVGMQWWGYHGKWKKMGKWKKQKFGGRWKRAMFITENPIPS